VRELVEQIEREVESAGLPPAHAFSRVAAERLGLDTQGTDVSFVDGAGDWGVDFWVRGPRSFQVYQCKTHELQPHGVVSPAPYGQDGVSDLSRAYQFLASEPLPDGIRGELRKLWFEWHYALEGAAKALDGDRDSRVVSLDLSLVILGDTLTAAAEVALESLRQQLEKPTRQAGAEVSCRVGVITLTDLVERRWREENREWRDREGHKRQHILLTPEEGKYIGDDRGCVFYCRARDLVQAYADFGYQLFEPNVRCGIRSSAVNRAIKESAGTRTGRHQFKFLNNGLTVVCSNWRAPSQNKQAFRVDEPGVVNGLQTVVSLSDAYDRLSPEDKCDFDAECFVLVRLLRASRTSDANAIVRATNTQNPMNPRNLAANEPEQVDYERLLADRGWFYERKDGAWDAFSQDEKRWRTLPNRSRSHFSVKSGGAGRPRIRRADNVEVAQAWLSFIGFANEAVHNQRDLFTNRDLYDLVFLQQTQRHGADLGFRRSALSDDDRVYGSPSPHLMLAAFLAQKVAKKTALTPQENRRRVAERLSLDPTKQGDLEQLADDKEYILNQALNGMSFVFVEALGYLLYRSLAGAVHQVGSRLLGNGLFADVAKEYDLDAAAASLRDNRTAASDILAVAWGAFQRVVDGMVAGPWSGEFRAVASKPAVLLAPGTREQVRKGLDNLHEYTTRRTVLEPWADALLPPHGLYGFLSSAFGG